MTTKAPASDIPESTSGTRPSFVSRRHETPLALEAGEAVSVELVEDLQGDLAPRVARAVDGAAATAADHP